MKLQLLVFFFISACFNCVAQAPLQYRDSSIQGPQTFAMMLGVSKYKYVRPLTYADKDAEMFRDFLLSAGGGKVKEQNIFCLLNEKATNAAFWSKGFQWLKAKQLQKGDKLFIYLAGHGDAIDEDQYFFLSYDCNPAGDKNNYLVGGAIQLYNLKKKIAYETAKGVDVFFVMDACRTSELPGGKPGQSLLTNAISEKKAGEIMMLATTAGEEALEDASIGNGHGLFTYFLVDGLCGLADSEPKDNLVSFSEISNYVERNVQSVSSARFKKKQDPVFCCEENRDKIISRIDPLYLQKWIQSKKKGGVNSINYNLQNDVDTLLLETYQRFNRAIKNNSLTGRGSAEEYYGLLDKKFPGNPYTLDAKTTLAAEYINDAQKRINNYLDCGFPVTSEDKNFYAVSGNNLQKSIDLLKYEEPEFASSFYGRMYLLKAMGDYSSPDIAIQYARAAQAIEPGAAYIDNLLARLHLSANRPDSALYYAERAARIAPNWKCAMTTLSEVKNISLSKIDTIPKKKTKPGVRAGFTFGGGVTRSNPNYVNGRSTNVLNAASRSAAVVDIGLILHVPVSSAISIRPTALFIYGNMNIYFLYRNANGDLINYGLGIRNNVLSLSTPLVIRIKARKTDPYFMVGPAYNYTLHQDSSSRSLLGLKTSVFMAHAGFGMNFFIPKTGVIISPELKYGISLSDLRDPGTNTNFSNSLSSLRRQEFLLGVSIRKK